MYVLPVVYRKSVMLTRIGGCDWVAFIPRNLQLIAFFFFFNKKTEYEMRIRDWSSDVCSSDLFPPQRPQRCASTNSATTASCRHRERRRAREIANCAGPIKDGRRPLDGALTAAPRVARMQDMARP